MNRQIKILVLMDSKFHWSTPTLSSRKYFFGITLPVTGCHGAQRNYCPMHGLVKHALANLTNTGSPHRYQASYAVLSIQRIHIDLSPLSYSCLSSI
ncbi:MAG: hypothetical protein V2J65_08890, partial [Desulfobacteraceae bacterium]|nr:hypothetical protein [Desulfobacteraceae bacterium]